MIISETIDKKVSAIAKQQSEIIESKIRKIIAENDCKPSDVIIHVRGHLNYEFSVKKDEFHLSLNHVWGIDDNQ